MEHAGSWRPKSAPRESVEVGDLVVRRYVSDDAEALSEAIGASIDHLRPWMAWVAREPVEMSARRALIVEWDRAWNERTNFTMGIFDGDTLVGGTGLHVRGHPGVLEIGYWVRADRVRTGIATRIVEVLVRSAFEIDDVEAVEIHHDVANIASGMVPEKAGFTFDREYDRPCEAPGDCGRGRAWITRRVR